jgi:hypothetical protein
VDQITDSTAEQGMRLRGTEGGVRVRTMEILTAVGFAGCGAVAITDSLRLGAGWSGDGPQSGYFPFWIGVLLVFASIGNLVIALRGPKRGVGAPMFLTWEQGRTVAQVLAPTAIYVAAIPVAGIYVPSALLVTWFMWRLGGFHPLRGLLTGIATAVVTFVVFEIWFLVALPKGPVEEWLGF